MSTRAATMLLCALAFLFSLTSFVSADDKTAKDGDKPAKATAVPDEAKGFIGTIEGTLVSKKQNGNTLTVTVTKATPTDDSKIKDGTPIVGKDLTITIRWEKKDGAFSPMAEDQASVKGFKKGDALKLEVTYMDSLEVLRLTAAPEKVDADNK